ncbi:MAG: adenylosuccinate lyase [Acidobacteriota bacterium]
MIARYTRPEMGRLWTEEAKFASWLEVELAACEAMAALGQVPKEAAARLRRNARFEVARIEKIEKKVRHDVIAFLSAVAERAGEDARHLHLGMTSSDVLDTAMALRLGRATGLLLEGVDRLLESLKRRALEHRHTPMIGRTHGVHAEPMTLGLKFALWYDQMRRNRARLERAREAVSVGKISGAVGTYAQLDPAVEEKVCRRLELSPARVSSQIVPRDGYAELLCAIAITGASIEQGAVEVRSLQRTEIRELEEPFGSAQKGSSAMPHKRNPVQCEQLSGLSRLLRSHVQAALENVALWNERDISHSSVERVILPDSTILLDYMLDRWTWVIDGLRVYPEAMHHNLERSGGLVFSGQVLLALMRKGVARDTAYGWVQRQALRVWNEGGSFREAAARDPDIHHTLEAAELAACFEVEPHLRHVGRIYQRVFGADAGARARGGVKPSRASQRTGRRGTGKIRRAAG